MVHYPRNMGLGRVGALNPTCVLWCAQGYHENVVARGICNWEFSLLYVKCVPRRHQDGHLQSLPGDRGLPQEWYSSLRQACPHMCQGTLKLGARPRALPVRQQGSNAQSSQPDLPPQEEHIPSRPLGLLYRDALLDMSAVEP